ncbi:hypothetical protein [Thalassomonas sp. RHCl1]|uniref:hypothetical protein n=1 Tax=Thalassomonas sp. RHCl1 TaxID=2995320 RepID=UPI00248C53D1|nr:hypothetical protein [Thalassomonas sp. RHCl1]
MKLLTSFFTTTIALTLALSSTPIYAQDSAQHTSKAGKHSALAVSHGAASSAKVASAAVAVPLLVVGSAGVASVAGGSALIDSATKPKPLTVTEVTITADPAPNQAMQTKRQTTIEIKQEH